MQDANVVIDSTPCRTDCCNGENAAVAVRQLGRLKKSMSERDPIDMMVKFIQTAPRCVSGIERKGIITSVVQNIAIYNGVQTSTKAPHGTMSVYRRFPLPLIYPYTTVQHIMRRILNIYPYKIQAVQQLELHDPDIHKSQNIRGIISCENALGDSWQ